MKGDGEAEASVYTTRRSVVGDSTENVGGAARRSRASVSTSSLARYKHNTMLRQEVLAELVPGGPVARRRGLCGRGDGDRRRIG